jgi:hypothetical protein
MRGVPAARRRRIIIIGLLRASAATAVLVAAYYLLPLGRLAGVPLGFSFVVGLVVLTTMSVYQGKIDHQRSVSGDSGDRSARNHRATVPASVRSHLLFDGSGRSQ